MPILQGKGQSSGLQSQEGQGALQTAVDDLIRFDAGCFQSLDGVSEQSHGLGDVGVAAEGHRAAEAGAQAGDVTAVVGAARAAGDEGGVVDLQGGAGGRGLPGDRLVIEGKVRVARMADDVDARVLHQFQHGAGVGPAVAGAVAAVVVKSGQYQVQLVQQPVAEIDPSRPEDVGFGPFEDADSGQIIRNHVETFEMIRMRRRGHGRAVVGHAYPLQAAGGGLRGDFADGAVGVARRQAVNVQIDGR